MLTNQKLSHPKTLYSWPTSPFGAKVKTCIKALNIDDIEIVNYHPWQNDDELRALNPLNKIPVLILDSGEAIYDSPVICEYLNDYAKGNLIPDAHKYEVLRIQALCDGILDAGVSTRYETHFRPEPMRSHDWVARQMDAMEAAFHKLADDLSKTHLSSPNITLATISVMTALFYVELRYADFYQHKIPSALKAWHEQRKDHGIFIATKPKDNLPLPQNLKSIGR